jgi:hypothetical protein
MTMDHLDAEFYGLKELEAHSCFDYVELSLSLSCVCVCVYMCVSTLVYVFMALFLEAHSFSPFHFLVFFFSSFVSAHTCQSIKLSY